MDVRIRLRPEDGRGHRRGDGPLRTASCSDGRRTRCSSRRGRRGPSRTTRARRSSTTRPSTSSRGRSSEGTWRNSEIIGPYDAERIRRLKEEVEGDIYVSGSVTLVRALLADGLVDELHLFVYPLTLGTGTRLFDEKAPNKLVARAIGRRIRTASSTSRTGRSDGVRRTTAGPRRRRGDDRRDLAPGLAGRAPRARATGARRHSNRGVVRNAIARTDSGATVATVDGAVVGFIMVVDDEVEQVYVASGARGTGVADELMREAERQVRTNGHTRRGWRSSPATPGPRLLRACRLGRRGHIRLRRRRVGCS